MGLRRVVPSRFYGGQWMSQLRFRKRRQHRLRGRRHRSIPPSKRSDTCQCELEPSGVMNNANAEVKEFDDIGEEDPQLKAMGIQPTAEDFHPYSEDVDPDDAMDWNIDCENFAQPSVQRFINNDFFGSLATYPELILELSQFLSCKSFVSLYAISKDFNEIINGHMTYVLKNYVERHAPESSKIFLFKFYDQLCMLDPVGKPHPTFRGMIRKVPSLKWMQMVIHREKAVRDILACMAREGHRMPRSMSLTLKKTWLTMDIATSASRSFLMHNTEFWTDVDLYNVMMFVIKLDMRCNDPVASSGDDGMRKLFLGQRGLTPLRNLLKRTAYTNVLEIVEMAVRYQYTMQPEHLDREMPILSIPHHEIGIGHLEAWGAGRAHLYRIDELVYREGVRRGLDLEEHFDDMLLWGYVDPITRQNIQVTDEEKYMSDDEDEYEYKPGIYNRSEDDEVWASFDLMYDEGQNDEDDDGGQHGEDDDEMGDNENGNMPNGDTHNGNTHNGNTQNGDVQNNDVQNGDVGNGAVVNGVSEHGNVNGYQNGYENGDAGEGDAGEGGAGEGGGAGDGGADESDPEEGEVGVDEGEADEDEAGVDEGEADEGETEDEDVEDDYNPYETGEALGYTESESENESESESESEGESESDDGLVNGIV